MIQQKVNEAVLYSFICQYDKSINILSELMQENKNNKACMLLINVKLSRCYEYVGNNEKCLEHWEIALKANEKLKNDSSEIVIQGRSELYLNQIRAMINDKHSTDEQIIEHISKTEAEFRKIPKNIPYLQLLYMKANFYVKIDTTQSLSAIQRCLKYIQEIKQFYQKPTSDFEKLAFGACLQYLSDLQKQSKGVYMFSKGGNNETGEEEEELLDEEEEEEENEHWSDAEVKE